MHCVSTYCILYKNQTLNPMKNFTLILCSLLFSSMAYGQLIINVTLCDDTASTVRIHGDWWDHWDLWAGPDAISNGDGTWTFTFDTVPTETMEYKVVVNGYSENLIGQEGGCVRNTDWWSYTNRMWYTTDPLEIDITYGQCAACATTGTETDLLSGLSIYPNPATDVLMVSNDNNIDRIQMVNIFGSVVLDQTIQANFGKLDVSAMSPGIYFVTVSANSQQVVRKITVK